MTAAAHLQDHTGHKAGTRSTVAHAPHASWPPLLDVLGPARSRRLFHRYKYQLLKLITTPERQRLLQVLNRHPAWNHLLDVDRRSFYVFYRRYLDRRYSLRQRFQAMITDLEVAAVAFGPDVAHTLAHGHSVRLCHSPLFSIDLTINGPTRIEGYWALTLNSADGIPLFNLSFGFIAPRSVLIASLQGLKRPDGNNREVIRSLTKQCHGLRPHALLLEAFRMACQYWGLQHIHGIDAAQQVTQYKKKADEFSFDYRAFWQENGATQHPDGHWHLPLDARRRGADEVPPHKRATYRKRYALLDTLPEILTQALANPTAHPGAPSSIHHLQRM